MAIPRFSVRQLEAFVTAAELNTFTQTAQRMHLTPSAISNLITEVEAALGFGLFERTTRKVALTAAGRQFLPSAIAVLRQLDRTNQMASDIRSGAVDVVRIAAPLAVASVILPKIIARHQSDRPRTTVHVVDTGVEWLADRVAIGEADIAIGPDRQVQSDVLRTKLYQTAWVAWCPPGHILAKRPQLLWSDLSTVTVFAAGRDHEHNVTPRLPEGPERARDANLHVVENISTALGLAAAGLGITFSPAYVAPLAKAMGLVMRPLVKPTIRRYLCLYEPADGKLSEPATAFRNFLLATTRRLGTGRGTDG